MTTSPETLQPPTFEAYVTARMEKDAVPSEVIAVTAGPARLAIRPDGAFVTELALVPATGGDAVKVLYAATEDERAVPKMHGTHAMCPAGPSKKAGGQHGVGRWLEYDIVPMQGTTDSYMAANAKTPKGSPVSIKESMHLAASRVAFGIEYANTSGKAIETSIGWHFYFDLPQLPDAAGSDLTVNGYTFDELVGDGTLEKVMNGEFQFWGGYDGEAEIAFPDGKKIKLESALEVEGDIDGIPCGLLLWRRPGAGSICIEPVYGFMPTDNPAAPDNTQIKLDTGHAIRLKASLTLL